MQGHHLNEVLRAGGNALAAGAAGNGVDARDLVANKNRVVITHIYAVAEPEATVIAGLRSAEQLRGHLATFYAAVI
ncbi:hypothetical protein SDC9_212756 [bioreactor metagenome]|uniref:Uncharacterized protein n=1 Tax=bioreactor metagenome TaxID=1076179 RepID=A0A645JNQ4_9ZZZZ